MDPGLEPEPENPSFGLEYGTRVFIIKTREPGFWICTTNLNISVCHQLDYGIESFITRIYYLIHYLQVHLVAYKSSFHCFFAVNSVLQEKW